MVGQKPRPAQRGDELGIEVAPRLAAGRVAAEQPHRPQRAQPLAATVVGAQELASPQRAVVAEADAVEGHAEHGRLVQAAAVLGQARGDVSVVMLDRDQRQALGAGAIASDRGGVVVGVAVAREHPGRVAVQPSQAPQLRVGRARTIE
jgi:hypothetical protein